MSSSTPTQRLPGLQLLRALAAIMVLVGHVIAEAEHYFGLSLAGDMIPWTRGVDLFFVISGFVIALSAGRHTGQPGAFLWRRAVRVVPLYWLFTTLMVAALLVMPGGVKDTALDPGQILSSYSFIPYARDDGRIAPVLSLGWTLNYEMFFYALAALSLALPKPLWALTGIMIALVGLGLVLPIETTIWITWTNPLILEFLFGIGLAVLWQRGVGRADIRIACALILSGLVALIVLDPAPLPRAIASGLPAALIVAGGTLFCPMRSLPGMIWGDAAYALYLSHRFVLRGATILLLPLLPANPFGAWVYVAVVTALALAVGLLTYAFVERPLLRAATPTPRGVPA
ncbi:MAG: acyltransferase [Pseudomonadota bacterium]